MRLSDTDDDAAPTDPGEREGAETDPALAETASPPFDRTSAREFVDRVGGLLDDDPATAADAVGDLLTVAREQEGPTRVAAGEALDAIGRRWPGAFEVWADALAAAAGNGDEEVAFFGLRALAQLAGTNPRAARRGLDPALETLRSPASNLRQAALSVLAEVGPTEPDAVKRADRPLAESLREGDEAVRTAAAIAAGRLLGAAPNAFPRTATALLDAVEDETGRPREYAHVALANFAREHPDNVPQKGRALAALAGATDEEFGLRRGALGDAVSALLAREFDVDEVTG